MDIIAMHTEHVIRKINKPTMEAFMPILTGRKTELEKIERKTFQTGDGERNFLDIYYPLEASLTPNGKIPVLFFVYGGGYCTGWRQFPSPYAWGYRTLGSFFTQRGIMTIIADYRLVPDVSYPASSEDVRDAVVWATKNVETIRKPSMPPIDTDYMFIMGHSAGAAHTKVLMLRPELRATLPPMRGMIWCGGPWFFDVEGENFDEECPVRSYFGPAELQRKREPRTLWNKLTDEEVKSLPEILLVQAEWEPRWLLITGEEIMKDLTARLGKAPKRVVGKGHNHVSLNWALCSGQGEEWAFEVADWIHNHWQVN